MLSLTPFPSYLSLFSLPIGASLSTYDGNAACANEFSSLCGNLTSSGILVFKLGLMSTNPPLSEMADSSSLLGEETGVSATEEPLRKSQRRVVESFKVGVASDFDTSPVSPLLPPESEEVEPKGLPLVL